MDIHRSKSMNNDVLMKRVITAVIGIIIILSLMIYTEVGMIYLAFFCALGALFEFFMMEFPSQEQGMQRWISIILGMGMISLIIFRVHFLYEGLTLFFLFLCIFYLSLSQYRIDLSQLFKEFTFSLSGIFYIGFLFSFLPKVRQLEDGVYWIFLVFVIPWISDTAGYFVGRSYGKLHFSIVSPNKTVEGSIAALIFTVLGVGLYKIWIFSSLTMIDCVILGLAGSLISQLGDLFESFIKRALSVKDSGVIIPGHGGILDRFDSVLFCAPFIYFYSLL